MIDVRKEIDHIVDWIRNYFINNGSENTKAVLGISGGKDSTIAAMLLAKALGPKRVVGVMMPNGHQSDYEDSCMVVSAIGCNAITVNIGEITNAFYKTLDIAYGALPFTRNESVIDNPMIKTNLPARVRMTTLYAVAAAEEGGGRVVNTSNGSEKFIGYCTKYGDLAGDLAILQNYTVREVYLIGAELLKDFPMMPSRLVYKEPSDGMCGKSDEDNLGFTYEELDAFLLEGKPMNEETYEKVRKRYLLAEHKRQCIQLPCPENQFMWREEE